MISASKAETEASITFSFIFGLLWITPVFSPLLIRRPFSNFSSSKYSGVLESAASYNQTMSAKKEETKKQNKKKQAIACHFPAYAMFKFTKSV